MMAESECPFCERSFDTEWGLGQHVGRYCDEASEDERDALASRLMEGNSPFEGKNHSEESKRQISETKSKQAQSEAWREAMRKRTGDDNPARQDAVRQKISEAVSGTAHPLYGMSRDDETIEKISESLTGREFSDDQLERMAAGQRGRELTEEHKRKISETLSGREYSEERIRKMLARGREYVPALGYSVDSDWETEIAFYLEALDVEYEREPCFDLPDGKHFPDFLVEKCIVEVKGWQRFANEERIASCLEEYPDYTYIVVGADVEADVRIPWTERDRLLELLHERL